MQIPGERTGIEGLDELTGGLHPGELVVIAGRPGTGKTALGLLIAEHLAVAESRAVLVFSLEMDGERMAERGCCNLQGPGPAKTSTWADVSRGGSAATGRSE